jgi:hypothetical protein
MIKPTPIKVRITCRLSVGCAYIPRQALPVVLKPAGYSVSHSACPKTLYEIVSTR